MISTRPTGGRSLDWLRFLLGVQETVSSNLTDPTIFLSKRPEGLKGKRQSRNSTPSVEIISASRLLHYGPRHRSGNFHVSSRDRRCRPIHVGALNCQAQESAMSLSQLSTVEISGNSTASADLLSPTFWSGVEASSKETFQQVVPQTVAGFLNSSQDWRDWPENESQSPPSWLGLGLQPELDSEVLSIGSAVVGARNAQQAAATTS
jgi:hypothetical protein